MAVFQTRSAGARSAPFSSNSFTSSALPEKLAAISGVTFDRFARFTSAPLLRASRAMPLWPFFSAIMSGVSPRRLREFTAAPPPSRRVTAATSPCRAATRSWPLGERSCAPAETAASKPSDKAHFRIDVIVPDFPHDRRTCLIAPLFHPKLPEVNSRGPLLFTQHPATRDDHAKRPVTFREIRNCLA